VAAIIADVMPSVHWHGDPAEAFLFHRTQEIAGILASVQTRRGDRCGVETAFKSEAGFFRRVIERADHEVFAVMAARTAGQSFILVRQPLHHLRPGNVGAQLATGFRYGFDGRERRHQSPKTDSMGPPIKTSMGNPSIRTRTVAASIGIAPGKACESA